MERLINSIVAYGHSGAGKTTSVAQVMHDALWVVTRKSNLNSYHTWLTKEPEKAAEYGCLPVPKKNILEVKAKEIDPKTGELVPVSQKELLDSIRRSYCLKVVSGEAPWKGIVFDEFSEFVERVYREIDESNRSGFEAIKQIKGWVSDICEIPSVTDLPMALICHASDPKYHEDGPKAGSLKYKGGPAMPVGTIIEPLCAKADAVLRLEVEKSLGGEVKRSYATTIDPDWEGKCRLWGVDQNIALDLRTLLSQAGWY